MTLTGGQTTVRHETASSHRIEWIRRAAAAASASLLAIGPVATEAIAPAAGAPASPHGQRWPLTARSLGAEVDHDDMPRLVPPLRQVHVPPHDVREDEGREEDRAHDPHDREHEQQHEEHTGAERAELARLAAGEEAIAGRGGQPRVVEAEHSGCVARGAGHAHPHQADEREDEEQAQAIEREERMSLAEPRRHFGGEAAVDVERAEQAGLQDDDELHRAKHGAQVTRDKQPQPERTTSGPLAHLCLVAKLAELALLKRVGANLLGAPLIETMAVHPANRAGAQARADQVALGVLISQAYPALPDIALHVMRGLRRRRNIVVRADGVVFFSVRQVGAEERTALQKPIDGRHRGGL